MYPLEQLPHVSVLAVVFLLFLALFGLSLLGIGQLVEELITPSIVIMSIAAGLLVTHMVAVSRRKSQVRQLNATPIPVTDVAIMIANRERAREAAKQQAVLHGPSIDADVLRERMNGVGHMFNVILPLIATATDRVNLGEGYPSIARRYEIITGFNLPSGMYVHRVVHDAVADRLEGSFVSDLLPWRTITRISHEPSRLRVETAGGKETLVLLGSQSDQAAESQSHLIEDFDIGVNPDISEWINPFVLTAQNTLAFQGGRS